MLLTTPYSAADKLDKGKTILIKVPCFFSLTMEKEAAFFSINLSDSAK
jgi:hypothetical protein